MELWYLIRSHSTSKAVQATLNFFGRTDALPKWYPSFDRVKDGLVRLAESVIVMVSQGMEFRCGSRGEMEEIEWQEG